MRDQHAAILLCLAIAAGIARADDLPRLKASWKDRDASVVAFSPDGKSVVSSGQEGLRLRDAETGEVRATLNPSYWLRNSTFTPDSRTLFTLSPSDKHLPVRTLDIQVWAVANGHLQDTIPYAAEGMDENCYALSEDGKTLAFVENSRRLPMRLKTSKIAFDRQPPVDVVFNTSPGLPRVRIWDVSQWKQIATVEGREPLAFSKDGKLLATGDSDWKTPVAKLWDAKTGKLIAELKERAPGLFPLAFSPDDRFLAADGFEGKSLWEVATGRRWAIDAKGSGLTSRGPVFSADGKLLFPKGMPWMSPGIGQGEEYYCFDISRMPPKRLDLGPGEIIISRAGNWYAAVQGERGGSNPRTVILRELPSLREAGRFDVAGLAGAGPSPDGRRLALLTGRYETPADAEARYVMEIQLVDPSTAQMSATIPSPGQTWGNYAWKFSPDGKSLAVYYRTGSNLSRPGDPDPSDRPLNVEIWELPPH
jgi:WD40 repeat protein